MAMKIYDLEAPRCVCVYVVYSLQVPCVFGVCYIRPTGISYRCMHGRERVCVFASERIREGRKEGRKEDMKESTTDLLFHEEIVHLGRVHLVRCMGTWCMTNSEVLYMYVGSTVCVAMHTACICAQPNYTYHVAIHIGHAGYTH